MSDLRSPKVIYAKGILFLVTGLLAAGLLILENPSLKTTLLLGVAIWAFARSYYFAFYVIEHYVDPGYHFAGLGSFVAWASRPSRKKKERSGETPKPLK